MDSVRLQNSSVVKGTIMLKFKADLTDDYLMCIDELKYEQLTDIENELERLRIEV